MKNQAIGLWLSGVSALSLSVPAWAAGAAAAQPNPAVQGEAAAGDMTDIVVTGSRTIRNGNNSPQPITVQSLGELQQTTPTTIADALNKLPAFQAGYTPAAVANTTNNRGGSYLNLRGFGLNRNLVLLDGRRATPTAQDGSVDANTLPEMLVQRVDVVTGGVSAVYGSDAISGVINFVLDHRFDGIKTNLEYGVTTYNDNPRWKAGIAAGTSLANGRIHVEGSYQHFQSEGVFDRGSRPWGLMDYCQLGAGTVASPARLGTDCKNSSSSYGGLVTSPAASNRLEFTAPGVLAPFVEGAATASSGTTQIGGNGTEGSLANLFQDTKVDQAFGRIDVNLGSGINAFIQASYTRSENRGVFSQPGFTNMVFSTTNAFLTPAQSARLRTGGAATFQMSKTWREITGIDTQAVQKVKSGTVGLDGDLGPFKWNLYYTYGDSNAPIYASHNFHNQRFAAALDAVRSPTNGEIVCNVTLTNPGLYPGCVPINPFGFNSTNDAAVAWAQDTTVIRTRNRMDDAGGTIAGDLFNLPAGPLSVALSGEFRRMRLDQSTTALSGQAPDCTGIRFNCGTAVYSTGTSRPLSVSQNIREGAFEATIPVLKDFVLAKSLEVNAAARYADYSVSGAIWAWKIGGTWRPIDDLTLRVTRSRDIRAPSLFDLFQPLTIVNTGLQDAHTGQSGTVPRDTTGNANLVPEVTKTLTLGAVYRPSWLRRFSVSVDYYKVTIDNAIIAIAPTIQNNQLCEDSGGTSIFCQLFIRPLPFSDRSAANYPIRLKQFPANAAFQQIEGVDVEVNYAFGLSAIRLPGEIALRLFAAHQPNFLLQTAPGQPTFNLSGFASSAFEMPGPTVKTKITGSVNYSSGGVSLTVMERWLSGLDHSHLGAVWSDPKLPAIAYTDVTASYDIGNAAGLFKQMQFFLTVQNLFNKQPRIYTQYNAGLINFRNPVPNGDDVLGRNFTAGLRSRF